MTKKSGDPPTTTPTTTTPTPKVVDAVTHAEALKIVQENEAAQKSINEQIKTRLELIKQIAQINDKDSEKAKDLSKSLQEQSSNLKVIEERLQIIKDSKKDLIDYEQILEEAESQKDAALKNELKIRQGIFLQLQEQKKLIEKDPSLDPEERAKKLKDLEEELKIAKSLTHETAEQIQNNNKQKEIKENIKSLGREILEGAKQYTLELDKHIMNISKLNGGYAEFGSKLREANMQIYQGTAGTGIMFEEANAAFAGLSQNFIALTTQSEKSISQMVEGAAQLTKLGVDATAASKGFDSLVNAMGKTPQQATNIQTSFVQMAAKNRLALGSVSQAFAENSSRFVGYGEQMTKVLEGLAEQSLKTGVAISGLVKIAQQFDTFEGAAKAVGNLNALLGGDYLNSIELLTATDDERIKLLKEGVAASGMQWESMNRFQKMAVANAAGINDLNEAGKIFGQTSLENTRQQEEASKVQKTLAEQAESVSTAMDRMRSVLNGVMIALDPVVSVFGLIVEYLILAPLNLAKWINKTLELEGVVSKVITVFGSLGTVLIMLAIKNRIFGGSFSGILGGMSNVMKKIPQYIASLFRKKAVEDATNTPSIAPAGPSAAIPAAAPAGPGRFMSFINSINPGKLIAAAAALVLVSLALFGMAKALQEFGKVGNPVTAAFLAAVSMLVLIKILNSINKMTGEILKGSVILGIMALVLLGFGIAVAKFTNVDWKVLGTIAAIIIGLGLALVGLGLALSGPQALAFGIGIGILAMMALTLGILGAALMSIISAIEKAAPALTNLGNSFKALFEIKDLDKNVTSIKTLLNDLASVNVEPINKLADAISLLASSLQTLAQLSTESSISVKGSAETIVNEQVKSAAVSVDKAGQSVSSAAASRNQSLIPAQQTTAFVPVVVQVDKKNILDILSPDIKLISGQETLNILNSVGIGQSAFYSQGITSVQSK